MYDTITITYSENHSTASNTCSCCGTTAEYQNEFDSYSDYVDSLKAYLSDASTELADHGPKPTQEEDAETGAGEGRDNPGQPIPRTRGPPSGGDRLWANYGAGEGAPHDSEDLTAFERRRE